MKFSAAAAFLLLAAPCATDAFAFQANARAPSFLSMATVAEATETKVRLLLVAD
jgi:hypothetical protein